MTREERKKGISGRSVSGKKNGKSEYKHHVLAKFGHKEEEEEECQSHSCCDNRPHKTLGDIIGTLFLAGSMLINVGCVFIEAFTQYHITMIPYFISQGVWLLILVCSSPILYLMTKGGCNNGQ